MPKVSIIVPVFNAEQYLPRCINSILTQTFTDFELILINDGSTDNTGEICDDYAQNDSRIIVVHKENGGANASRMVGVSLANGEWISFVDADDTITKEAIEILVKQISSNTDIIIGRHYDCGSKEILHTPEEYRKITISGKYSVLWGRLFRKHVITLDTFSHPKTIDIGEDMLTNIKIAFNTRKNILIIPNKIYNYNYYSNSISHSVIPSIEYECLFWEELKKAIPTVEISKYEPQLFLHLYRQWLIFCEYKITLPNAWKYSELNSTLINQLHKYKKHVNFINRFLIISNNFLIRLTLISLKKIYNKLPKCLKFLL